MRVLLIPVVLASRDSEIMWSKVASRTTPAEILLANPTGKFDITEAEASRKRKRTSLKMTNFRANWVQNWSQIVLTAADFKSALKKE